MFTDADLRNLFAIVCEVEREDIEAAGPITDKRWRDFQADPHGTFMRLSTDQQKAVADSVNRRMPAQMKAA